MFKVLELVINAPTIAGLIVGVISAMVTVTTSEKGPVGKRVPRAFLVAFLSTFLLTWLLALVTAWQWNVREVQYAFYSESMLYGAGSPLMIGHTLVDLARIAWGASSVVLLGASGLGLIIGIIIGQLGSKKSMAQAQVGRRWILKYGLAIGIPLVLGTGFIRYYLWDMQRRRASLVPPVGKTSQATPLAQQTFMPRTTSVVWSPDGGRVAVARNDFSVQVWEIAQRKVTYTYRGHHSFIYTLAWSPDSSAIASTDTVAQIWNASNGKLLFEHKGHQYKKSSSPQDFASVTSLAWSPDGKQLVFSEDGQLQMWNVQNNKPLQTFTNPNQAGGKHITWSPDGKYIAAGAENMEVQVSDAQTGKLVYAYRGHKQYPVYDIDTVAWSPDSKSIASSAGTGAIHIWNATDGSGLKRYQIHLTMLSALTWLPGGEHIISGDVDGTLLEWDVQTGKTLQVYELAGRGVRSWVMAAACSPRGKDLVVVTYNTVLEKQEMYLCQTSDAHIEYSTSI